MFFIVICKSLHLQLLQLKLSYSGLPVAAAAKVALAKHYCVVLFQSPPPRCEWTYDLFARIHSEHNSAA